MIHPSRSSGSLPRQQSKSKAERGARSLPEKWLVPAGLALIVLAIVRGPLKALGFDLPLIDSSVRQIIAGIVGAVSVGIGLFRWGLLLNSWRREKRLEKAYDQFILRINDLFFSSGGIKDRLYDYQKSGSREDWELVLTHFDLNQANLAELRSAMKAVATLGRDPEPAALVSEILDAKRYNLYEDLAWSRDPRSLAEIENMIGSVSRIEAMMGKGDVKAAQRAFKVRLEEAHDRRLELEKRLFP